MAGFIAGRTREEIRQSVGYNLMGSRFIVGTTTSAGGDATSVIDTHLRGGDDAHNGKHIIATFGDNDGEATRVNDYAQGTTDLTVSPAFSNTVPLAMTYELWEPDWSPKMIHDVMNQVILSAYGRAFDLIIDDSLHTGANVSRYPIPSTLAVISSVEVRTSIASEVVDSADSAWTETVDSGLTVAVDQEDYRRGGASQKITVASGAAASAKTTTAITSLDASGKTHLEFWIKSSIATNAGDIQILLDDTAACASPIETLNVPALTARIWTFVQVALATPELDTAIISLGVKFTTDNGAQVAWVDDFQVTNHATSVYARVSESAWSIDASAGEIVFSEAAVTDMGYALIRLKGGDEPSLTTGDSSVMEINEWFVICATTAQLFADAHGRFGSDSFLRLAAYWEAKTELARESLHKMKGRKTG